MSICLWLVGVRVVLQELSHICHYGLLIRFIHIHICRNAEKSSYDDDTDSAYELIKSLNLKNDMSTFIYAENAVQYA